MFTINKKAAMLFLGGVLFGTAGIKALSSKDAKKMYTHCTAATLRVKDCVMKTVTNVQENAEDILAEAKQINQEREEKEYCECCAQTVEEKPQTEEKPEEKFEEKTEEKSEEENPASDVEA